MVTFACIIGGKAKKRQIFLTLETLKPWFLFSFVSG
jgi:hypothetical protein